MKLQLALDGTLEQALSILQHMAPFVDIVEVGTPLIYREGMRAVREIRSRYPALGLLADLKIMDAGDEESSIAFEAGADFVTVLGVANDSTIRGAATAARRNGKQLVADLMQVVDKPARGLELLSLGVDYLCAHTAFDLQAIHNVPLDDLRRLRELPGHVPLAAAGGISLLTLDAVAALRPEIVIIGSAITGATDPVVIAQAVHERLLEYRG